jgi:hypothetical protein
VLYHKIISFAHPGLCPQDLIRLERCVETHYLSQNFALRAVRFEKFAANSLIGALDRKMNQHTQKTSNYSAHLYARPACYEEGVKMLQRGEITNYLLSSLVSKPSFCEKRLSELLISHDCCVLKRFYFVTALSL